MLSASADLGLAVVAAVAGLVLAALAAFRSKSALAAPLALLAVDQFCWNGATVGLLLTGEERWRWLGAAAAPLFLPFALHFVLAFVGRRQAHRRLLAFAYAVFAAQAVGAGLAGLLRGTPTGLSFWSGLLSLTLVPLAAFGFALVLGHLRGSPSPVERVRTWLLLLAMALLLLFAGTDLAHDLGAPVVPLSHVGSFAFNALLAVVAFQLGLLPVGRGLRGALFALLVALAGATAVLLSFALLSGSLALLAIAGGSLSLSAFALARRVSWASAQRRVGLERAANLGRFSAQMAHDLKNPIAAARGAVQFLEEEARAGRPMDAHAAFLTLVREQLDRMTATVDRYQRLGRLDLEREEVAVPALVDRVLALQAFASPKATVVKDVPALPPLRADPDLLGTALENLVKNAHEALLGGAGTITVRARVEEARAGQVLRLSVADSGAGMDARTREQAFTPFFTSKAKGSGLGLAWVQAVARAHGGEVHLTSAEGRGTVVELVLPLGDPGEHE